jgi:putative PIN family toxin of toxin-antitoxin system
VTRLVADTNVYISALVFGGVPQRVLELTAVEGFSVYVSPSITGEVEGVLLKKFSWTPDDLKTFLPPLWQRCISIRPTVRLMVCADPDDNHVLECAQAARADFLITGNARHFPKSHRTTTILSPRQFFEMVRGKAGPP